MSKNIGPFINRDLGYRDQPRAIFSSMPIGSDMLADFRMFFDDFDNLEYNLAGSLTGTVDNTITDVAAIALSTTNTYTDAAVNTAVNTAITSINLQLKELQTKINERKYEVVKDSGASIAAGSDVENGSIVLTSAATTDNDGVTVQSRETLFLVKSGKKLMFEARIKVSDADQCDMFIGLADTVTTNPEDVVAEGLARVGFELVDGSAVIQCVTDDDTASTKTSSGVSASDDTYIKLGFRTDGGSIRFYVNRALVYTATIPSAIAAVTLGPAFFGLSGNATGTHTRTCDYILVCQER